MSDTADLIAACYDELRRIASRQLDAGGSPTPTELVHEAWLRLRGREWSDEAHFRRTAAQAMRQLLVDRVRRRVAQKRGGGAERVTLTGLGAEGDAVDILVLDRAISSLYDADPRRGTIAELIVFGGFSQDEVAVHLGVSARTVKRDWRAARAHLMAELSA